MLCDGHVHVGYFRDRYYAPEDVVQGLRRIGVGRWAISSCSASGQPWKFVRREYEQVWALAPSESVLLLWLTPEMLHRSPDISHFDVLPFRGLKIHGGNGWGPNGKPFYRVFSIAQERHWPVLMHTGCDPECEAGRFLSLCHKYPGVNIVLAHGRPLNQALTVLASAENSWVDTSFMPHRDIKKIVGAGFGDRILFGTDYPAPSFFYKSPVSVYYRRRLASIRSLGNRESPKITSYSFEKVFG